MADSGVDALAVAIGSSHAMTSRTAALDHGLLRRLAAELDVPLVLHGSSGLPDDEPAAAVTGGMAKVDIGTALNLATTGAIREFLAAHPDAVDSRTYLSVGRAVMAPRRRGSSPCCGRRRPPANGRRLGAPTS